MTQAYEKPPTGAVGWMFGWVPATGYCKVRVDSVDLATTGDHDMRDFLNGLQSATGLTWTTRADGRMEVTGSGQTLTWLDRLGWLLGFDREGRQREGVAGTLTARSISPALIPLFSRTFERIDRERERSLVLDRWGRAHGYAWGDVDIFRWRVRMHRTGLEAWKTGWCARGMVTLTPFGMDAHRAGAVTAWSPSTPGGAYGGRLLGTEGGAQPIDAARTMFDLTLVTASSPIEAP